jgi:hypothetical protein
MFMAGGSAFGADLGFWIFAIDGYRSFGRGALCCFSTEAMNRFCAAADLLAFFVKFKFG